MRIFLTVGLAGILGLWMTSIATAQENAPRLHGPDQARQGVQGPRSIDQELDHLTKELELTPNQRKQVRSLLQEHHEKIQALLDNNPRRSRQDLASQIHAISDETHHQIHALLTEHQKQLEKAMQEGMHNRDDLTPLVVPTAAESLHHRTYPTPAQARSQTTIQAESRAASAAPAA